MMKKSLLLLLFLIITGIVIGQENSRELALQKVREAVQLMDDGKFEESIEILENCKEMDGDNYLYSYEISLAYAYMQNYSAAIEELKKTVKMSGINSQVYQLLGNSYSLLGKRNKAIKTYKKGLSKFKNAGNLYLEIGNIYLSENNFLEAIESYEAGVNVDPMFSSNYYRLAELYLNSNNKVPGLIYGEIFMNIERTTDRVKEMSELLYYAYASSIQISEKHMDFDFCKLLVIQDIDDFNNGKKIDLSYCAVFNKCIRMATIGQTELSLESLIDIRKRFIEFYFYIGAEKYPVVLYDYHKEMIEAGVFEAYNHYLFQISNPKRFEDWLGGHEKTFDRFSEWYTLEENILSITTENRYLRY